MPLIPRISCQVSLAGPRTGAYIADPDARPSLLLNPILGLPATHVTEDGGLGNYLVNGWIAPIRRTRPARDPPPGPDPRLAAACRSAGVTVRDNPYQGSGPPAPR
jgi:hypothetical protein